MMMFRFIKAFTSQTSSTIRHVYLLLWSLYYLSTVLKSYTILFGQRTALQKCFSPMPYMTDDVLGNIQVSFHFRSQAC